LNEGNQITPLGQIPGLLTGHFDGTGRWDLGDPDDPDRGVIYETKLSPSAVSDARSYSDWHAFMVWDGTFTMDGREFSKDDIVVVEAGCEVPEVKVGDGGAHLIEMSRTQTDAERA
jgi:hypothetical protein